MPYANIVTGANLFYEDLNPSADGYPIIALHGLLGTGRLNLGHVMDWLAEQGYRVIAPSLRGYGESTPKPREFQMDFYERDARDIIALMDALEIQQAHILGYSDGGEVALICAGLAPDRWVSVASIGALGKFVPEMRAVVQGYRPGSEWITEEEQTLHGIPDRDAFARGWQRAVLTMIDAGGDLASKYADQITAPVLIMLGERDRLNPRSGADAFVDKIKQGRVVMFDAGHPIHDEQPDTFRDVYLKHVRQTEQA